MSTTNAPAYCEEADVRKALQETAVNMDGPLDTANVEAAIYAASRWLRSAADAHWYDSNAASDDLISTSPVSTTGRTLSVPSSPHAQRGQLFKASDAHGNHRYPNTRVGPYCRVTLPVNHAESIDTLDVRQRGGEYEDWVAGDQTEGPGEDYYLRVEGGAGGRSYLLIHAGTIGPRTHFDDLIEIDLTYGRDWDDAPWDDVRRGVAAVAAAQLVSDDDVLTQIPDSGQLIGLDTQVQQLYNQAFSEPGYLSAYVPTHPVA